MSLTSIFKIIYVFILFSFFMKISNGNSLSKMDRQLILDFHNSIRTTIVKSIIGFQYVSNMQTLSWSEDLAMKSKLYPIKCDINNKKKYDLRIENQVPYFTFKYTSFENSKLTNITSILESIFELYNNSKNGFCINKEKCRITNQIFEPLVTSVGCSVTQCPQFFAVFICIYNKRASKLNNLNPKYINRLCANCPRNLSKCFSRSLCLSYAQCQSVTGRSSEVDCGESDKQLINYYQNLVNSEEPSPECFDKRRECQEWADNSYCYISSVQIYCPRACAMCPNSLEPDEVECEEKPSRFSICQQVKSSNLCYSPKMKDICPLTCENHKCAIQAAESTSRSSKVTESMEPFFCQNMKDWCTIQGIQRFCKKTCAFTISWKRPYLTSAKSSLLKEKSDAQSSLIKTRKPVKLFTETEKPSFEYIFTTDEPIICREMEKLCSNSEIKLVCSKTCDSRRSRQISTSIPLKQLRYIDSQVSTKDVSTTLIRSPSRKHLPEKFPLMRSESPISNTRTRKSVLTTKFGKSPEPTPSKLTRKTPTITKSALIRPTTSRIVNSAEPSMCLNLKDKCSILEVKTICRKTCATTSLPKLVKQVTFPSSKISPEPPFCPKMVHACASSQVKAVCHHTCDLPGLTTEPEICLKMKDLCLTSGVRHLCKTTCAKSTAPRSSTSTPLMTKFRKSISSTESFSQSSLTKPAEPPFCSKMVHVCASPQVKAICHYTCDLTTSVMSVTSSVPLIIRTPSVPLIIRAPSVPLIIRTPSVPLIIRTPSKSISTSQSALPTKSRSYTSLSTEPPFCPKMVHVCASPQVKAICHYTCAQTTSVIPVTPSVPLIIRTPSKSISTSKYALPTKSRSYTSMSTEPDICHTIKHLCASSRVRKLCYKTCDTTRISTEPSICFAMKHMCSNDKVKQLCKRTCDALGPTRLWSPTSDLPGLTTEPEICLKMKDLCLTSGVRHLCKRTCAKSTAPRSSTLTPLMTKFRKSILRTESFR